MSSQSFNSCNFYLKPPYKNKTQEFQQKCGQCLLALEQYKLKTNFIGCNMNKQEYKKYYNYYETKPKKRLELVRGKLQNLMRTYQRNTIYLQSLQLKSVNNMMRNYRRRMNLMTNQPAGYSYAKFEKDEVELLETIISNDYSKFDNLEQLLNKIKNAEQNALKTLDQSLEKNSQKKANYVKALKIINKSEIRYFRFFQNFERSIANMINQIHAHMEKLGNFYTAWQNLGSSLIYEMKSDKEVFIDKSLEQKKGRNYSNYDEDQDQILQVIDVLPAGSKVRQHYEQKLEDIKNKNSRCYTNNSNLNYNQVSTINRFRRSNLKQSPQSITKVSWYETEAEDTKEYNFNDSMVLKETEQGYFRYTFQQLHHETLEYLDELRSKKIVHDFTQIDDHYSDRFYLYCEKKERSKEEYSGIDKLEKYNVPRQMSFGCWFDRFGPKGVFNVADFPINLVQRRIQFENDRQAEMQGIDEKRRKQYNNKQTQLNAMQDKGPYNIGYKDLNPNKELQQLRAYLTAIFDPEYLPQPKDQGDAKQQKKVEMIEDDFSQSQNEEEKEKQQEQMSKALNFNSNEEEEHEGEYFNMLQNHNSHEQQKDFSQKQSKIFEQKWNNYQIKKQKQRSHLGEEHRLKQSSREIKQKYPWFQTKRKQKQPLQVFIENYVPELQKIIIQKMKTEYTNLGYSEEEIERVHYKYLMNCQLQTLKRCISDSNTALNLKAQKQNISKMYLVNYEFYVKIQPLFFSAGKRTIKIFIFMLSTLREFQKLKANLETILSHYGQCNFHLNLELIERVESAEQKFYGMIGHILKNQKSDKTTKIILENDGQKTGEYTNLMKQGEKIYKSFDKYYKQLLKVNELN